MSVVNLKIDQSIFLPAFYPYLMDYNNKVEFYYGGRGSGKTYFCIQKLLLKGLQEKRFILLMNKQTNRVVDGVWRELRQAIEFFKLTPYFDFNKSEYRATCKVNGTEFRCLGLQESERIKGYADISDVYMDECSSFTIDDFLLIFGTLRSKKYKLPLQIILTTNPVSKLNWIYKYFGFEDGNIPPNTFIHHSTYLDNPKADIAQYMEALKLRNPTRYKIEALGEFASLDQLVYNNWKVEQFEPNYNLELLCGLDWGFSADLTAFVCSLLDEPNKKIYVFNEWCARGKTNPEIASAITALGFAKSVIIADSAEPKSCEELKRAGISRIKPSVKGPDSIRAGIQKLSEYDIIVSPACPTVIEELENYCYEKDKSTGEYTNKPIDAFNHCLDALRYSIQSVGKGRLGTIEKHTLGV